MSDDMKKTRFTLDDLAKAGAYERRWDDRRKTSFTPLDLKGQTLRDKDNAAPRVTPPSQAQHPHPQMAPPGMSGIKTGSKRYTFAVSIQVDKELKMAPGEKEPPKKAFKSLAPDQPDKGLHKSR